MNRIGKTAFRIRYILFALLMAFYFALLLFSKEGFASEGERDTELTEENFAGYEQCIEIATGELVIKYIAGEGGHIALANPNYELDGAMYIPDMSERYGVGGAVALPNDGMEFVNWTNEMGESVFLDNKFIPSIENTNEEVIYYAIFKPAVNPTDTQELQEDVILEEDSLEEFDSEESDSVLDSVDSGELVEEVIKDALSDENVITENTNYIAFEEPSMENDINEQSISNIILDEVEKDRPRDKEETQHTLKRIYEDSTQNVHEVSGLETSYILENVDDIDAFIPVPCGLEINIFRRIVFLAIVVTIILFIALNRLGRRHYGCELSK